MLCCFGWALGLLSTFTILQDLTFSSAYVPPSFPLAPLLVPTPDDLRSYANEVVLVLRDATLPTSNSDLFAIVISESCAGFLGGIASRGVAFVLNDQKRDASLLKGTTTGAYFGARGLVRALGGIAGLPRPVTSILAGLAGSIISESAKLAGRIDFEKENDGFESDISQQPFLEFEVEYKDDTEETTKVESPKNKLVSWQEICQDVSKWVVYDLLIPTADDGVAISDALKCGLVSGLTGQTILELFTPRADRENGSQLSNQLETDGQSVAQSLRKRALFSRFLKAGLEGAGLFAIYEQSLKVFATDPAIVSNPVIEKFLETEYF